MRNQRMSAIVRRARIAPPANSSNGAELSRSSHHARHMTKEARRLQRENNDLKGRLASSEAENVRLRQELQEAEELARRDYLTRAWNRRGMEEILGHFIAEFKRAEEDKRLKSTFSILYIDVNDFKLINDTFGHEVGDKALWHICNIIRGLLREEDYLCRCGGDEFVAILSDSDRHVALHVADRIEEELKLYPLYTESNQEVSVSVTVGFKEMNFQIENPQALVRHADISAHKRKKEKKRGRT